MPIYHIKVEGFITLFATSKENAKYGAIEAAHDAPHLLYVTSVEDAFIPHFDPANKESEKEPDVAYHWKDEADIDMSNAPVEEP